MASVSVRWLLDLRRAPIKKCLGKPVGISLRKRRWFRDDKSYRLYMPNDAVFWIRCNKLDVGEMWLVQCAWKCTSAETIDLLPEHRGVWISRPRSVEIVKYLASYVVSVLHLVRLALEIPFIGQVIGLVVPLCEWCVRQIYCRRLPKTPTAERHDKFQDGRGQHQGSSSSQKVQIFPTSKIFQPDLCRRVEIW